MRLFDLHCDTVTACYEQKCSIRNNSSLHISLERGKRFSPWAQCFAIWIPDTMRGQKAVDFFAAAASYFEQISEITICRTSDDFNKSDTNCYGLLTVEGGAVLAGELSNIERLKRHHVLALTLTWNGSCELGDGAMVLNPKGLTSFGRQVIPALEAAEILVDVSHSSDLLFYDVASLATKPFLATHSNSRAVCNHPRNLTDEQFLEIHRRGGLVGLNLHRWFLKKNGEPTLEDVFRHVYHFLSLGGEKTLAMGCDFDGGELPNFLQDIGDLERLGTYFSQMGLNDRVIDQIFYQNAKEFFDSL